MELIQGEKGYRYSVDAFALADFVAVKPGERAADLGAGNGVISILLARLHPSITICGIEIQEKLADLARKNVAAHGLEGRIEIAHHDLRRIEEALPGGSFTLVFGNPPYRRVRSGRVNPNIERAVARHEIAMTLEDLLRAASHLLPEGGRMALIHIPERLPELMNGMVRRRMAPSRMRLVHGKAERPAEMVLVEGIKGGRNELRVEAPLVMFQEDDSHTPAMRRIFERWPSPAGS